MVLDPLPKAAYTHGLELIYTLQDVDIASVRVLGAPETPKIPSKSSVVHFPIPLSREEQLEFDFCKTVNIIDCEKIVRAFLTGVDRKKAYALLEKFHLHELAEAIPSEAFEVRKFPSAKKEAWALEVMEMLRSPAKKNGLEHTLRLIVDPLFKPWIQGRKGLASQLELDERWQRVCENPDKAISVLKLLKHVFEAGDFYGLFLFKLERNLYTIHSSIACDYEKVICCAKTYFRSSAAFELSHLTSLLGQELALEWAGFPNGFIEKCLSMSSEFRVRKNISGKLLVKTNIN